MYGDLQYLPVNWIDGMKISRQHFEETGRYLEERLLDTAAQQLTDHGFGILPAADSLKLTVICETGNRILLELVSCKAVTPGGFRIQILPDSPVRWNTTLSELLRNYNLPAAEP